MLYMSLTPTLVGQWSCLKTFVDCIVDQDDLTNLLWMWQNSPLVFFLNCHMHTNACWVCIFTCSFHGWRKQLSHNSPEVFLGWRKSNQDNTVFCWIHEWTTMRNNDQQLLIGQCPKSVFAPNGVWRSGGFGMPCHRWPCGWWSILRYLPHS